MSKGLKALRALAFITLVFVLLFVVKLRSIRSLSERERLSALWMPSLTSGEISNTTDQGSFQATSGYLSAILDPQDNTFDRLACKSPDSVRYDYLSRAATSYYFALDIHQSASLLPGLIGSIMDAARFLGPEKCTISIVEGRSTDATYEILKSLEPEIVKLGISYFLTSNEVNPLAAGQDRIKILAELRNQALQPLRDSTLHAEDTTVIFLNDVALCVEDILELIHQRLYQRADMTCAMDWVYVGNDPTFHDVWIARGMNGDSFFEIPADGNWDSAWNLFWNDDTSKARWITNRPFQVFSCWNGAVAFTAKPILDGKIRFRRAYEGECYQGEPKLFCKDMWHIGYSKIAVVPSVNLEYSDEAAKKIKEAKGYVHQLVENEDASARIQWQAEPPPLVKCMPTYENQIWLSWDEQLAEQGVFPRA
ncbi:MAG: hypothetical protein Q9227_000597 [Pyrenula ochraceoflavens]